MAGRGEERGEEANVLNKAVHELHISVIHHYFSTNESKQTQILFSVEHEGKPAFLRVEQTSRIRVNRTLQVQIRPLHSLIVPPHASLPHILPIMILPGPRALSVFPAALPVAAIVIEKRSAAMRKTHLQFAAIHIAVNVVESANAAEIERVVDGDRGR